MAHNQSIISSMTLMTTNLARGYQISNVMMQLEMDNDSDGNVTVTIAANSIGFTPHAIIDGIG